MKVYLVLPLLLAFGLTQVAGILAQDVKPIPENRNAMLEALDALKHRKPRLPLQPLTEDPDRPVGSLGVVNNGRMRQQYLPEELYQRSGSRTPDPNMVLPYDFSVELFWLVSRINNCHYCLGHQEVKLEKAGVDAQCRLELDTDWSRFDARQRAAFAFTKKLTQAPQQIELADIDALRKECSDREILEISFLVGRYNSTNRWTDSLGIPQEDHREFTNVEDSRARTGDSIVVRRDFSGRKLPVSVSAWKETLDKPSKIWLELQDEQDSELPLHIQLLNQFPVSGAGFVTQLESAESQGKLDEQQKLLIWLACSFEDGASYVQKQTVDKLQASGMPLAMQFENLNSEGNGPNQCLVQFSRKLTALPQKMTDADIERLSQYFSDPQIAEIVYRVGLAAQLDRITIAAGL